MKHVLLELYAVQNCLQGVDLGAMSLWLTCRAATGILATRQGIAAVAFTEKRVSPSRCGSPSTPPLGRLGSEDAPVCLLHKVHSNLRSLSSRSTEKHCKLWIFGGRTRRTPMQALVEAASHSYMGMFQQSMMIAKVPGRVPFLTFSLGARHQCPRKCWLPPCRIMTSCL